MKENNLLWTSCVRICTDGPPSMVGSKKGFTAPAKKENEKIIYTHCFLHRANLVTKTIGNELKEVMDQVVQMVNYIKRRPLQSRLLAKICEEMGEKFTNVLLHTLVLKRKSTLPRIRIERNDASTF